MKAEFFKFLEMSICIEKPKSKVGIEMEWEFYDEFISSITGQYLESLCRRVIRDQDGNILEQRCNLVTAEEIGYSGVLWKLFLYEETLIIRLESPIQIWINKVDSVVLLERKTY